MKTLISINQFVQDIKSINILIEWFSNLEIISKKNAIIEMFSLVAQSHPQKNDLFKAIELSQVKKTSTAVVMLTNPNKNYLKFGYETLKLNEKELEKVWIILLNILKISDNRRKNSEDPHLCNHWWHKDLSNQEYIDSLLSLNSEILDM